MGSTQDDRALIKAQARRIAELEGQLERCSAQLWRVETRLWGEVTDREAAEESLRESEAENQSLIRNTERVVGS